jgi:UDP-N-acetylmuramate--alanine ligase
LFDLVLDGAKGGAPVAINDITLPMPGFHNVENAVAAATVALQLGLSAEQIKYGLSTYKGVKRRFEYWIERPDLVYLDDYAHHPTEIAAFVNSVRTLYPGWEIIVVFQPHLYSRTRDFMAGFAASLALASQVVLLDIYPAREQPIEGVTSQALLTEINQLHDAGPGQAPECHLASAAILLPKAEIVAHMQKIIGPSAGAPPRLIATVGAGDIDTLVPQLAQALATP